MDNLKERTKKFAIDTINFCSSLPRKQVIFIITNQLIRSATSVGANYRSARRARSKAEFISKLSLVEEEADESIFWFELLESQNIRNIKELYILKNESNQLVSIIVASKKSAKGQ